MWNAEWIYIEWLFYSTPVAVHMFPFITLLVFVSRKKTFVISLRIESWGLFTHSSNILICLHLIRSVIYYYYWLTGINGLEMGFNFKLNWLLRWTLILFESRYLNHIVSECYENSLQAHFIHARYLLILFLCTAGGLSFFFSLPYYCLRIFVWYWP